MKSKVLALLFVLLMGLLPVQAQEDPGTIVDIAVADGRFTTLVAAVEAAGLVDVLADPNAQWTVFAPTDDAFAALPEGTIDTLLADTELLTRVLTYHVVEGAITSDQLTSMMAPSMEMAAPGAPLMGSELEITVGDDGSVMVNDATVIIPDIIASNGVIHVIDSVLVPPDVAEMLMGGDMMQATEEADMMGGDMMMGGALFATTNPAELEGDSIVGLDAELSATGNTFGGFSDIANVQSVFFNSNGDAFVSYDADEASGGIFVLEGLGDSDSMEAIGAPTRAITGANAGIVAPKGILVIEELDLVLVANNGASNVKGFALDAEGDVAPTVLINDFGTAGGSVWDMHYDAASDTLFVAGTTGSVLIYGGFSENLGSTLTKAIVPADADGNPISVNLHGIYYVANQDTLILSDVGAADNNTDGQLFTISGVMGAEGNVPVTTRVAGADTMLGNPVDIAFDGTNLYVAEKANDLVLRYDNYLSLSGDVTTAADVSLAVTKPESLAYYGGGMMMGEGDMMATEEADMMATEEAMMPGTIVDIAVADGRFTTLVAAVEAVGLVDVLADPNAQWTVFAPTDDAFAALPEGTIEALLADTELLTRILTYHVVEGAITSDQLTSMMAPSMEMAAPGAPLMGSELEITVGDDGSVMVNGANVIIADIIASNGVIHVIDAVLLPPDVSLE